MHQDHGCFGRDNGQTLPHTGSTGRTASNNTNSRIGPLVRTFVGHIICWNDNDDTVAVRSRDVNCMVKYPTVTDDFVLLHRPKAPSRATRHDNCPDLS